MVQFSDDIYTGPVGPEGFILQATGAENPTAQYGVGPLGRTVVHNVIPLALATANIAALQASTANVPLTLTAGTGITTGFAPTGQKIYQIDTPRCVSLTSTSNLSAINYLIQGFDYYGQAMSQLLAGPNNNTVNTTKAFYSVYAVTPSATNSGTVSVGTSDIFGLPFRMIDAGYILSVKWAGVLTQNAGTFVAAVQTSPATTSTGDVRGTFAQSGAASNGTNRLLIMMHVDGTQCGGTALLSNAIGVPQV